MAWTIQPTRPPPDHRASRPQPTHRHNAARHPSSNAHNHPHSPSRPHQRIPNALQGSARRHPKQRIAPPNKGLPNLKLVPNQGWPVVPVRKKIQYESQAGRSIEPSLRQGWLGPAHSAHLSFFLTGVQCCFFQLLVSCRHLAALYFLPFTWSLNTVRVLFGP